MPSLNYYPKGDFMVDERPSKRARAMSLYNFGVAERSHYTEMCYPLRTSHSNHTESRPLKPLPSRKPTHRRVTVEPPQFSGSFNLFRIPSDLPNVTQQFQTSLVEDDPVYFDLISKALAGYQSTPTCNTQLFLPRLEDQIESGSGMGSIRSIDIRDPLNGEQLDIELSEIRLVNKAPHIEDQNKVDSGPLHSCPYKGLHVVASARIIGEGCVGDIVDGFGELTMWRAWVDSEDRTGIADVDGEVFQGQFWLKVFYGDAYEKQGHGYMDDYDFAFWALRYR